MSLKDILHELAGRVNAPHLHEQIDGAVGLTPTLSNLPEIEWPIYVAKVTALAERY